MNPTFKASLLRYWLAMNASGLTAGVHAVQAFFGVAGVHAVQDSVPALNLQQFAAVFLIAFGRAILAYLDAHPISQILQEQTEKTETPLPPLPPVQKPQPSTLDAQP